MKTKKIVIAALLTAISIVIPLIFPKVYFPPFSATLTAHVPVILAMFISPLVAALVSAGSATGFLIAFPALPVIAARAATHIIFSVIGSFMIRYRFNAWLVLVLTGLIHSASELVVVMNMPPYIPMKNNIPLIYFIGFLAHHSVDFIVAILIYKAFKAAKVTDLYDAKGI